MRMKDYEAIAKAIKENRGESIPTRQRLANFLILDSFLDDLCDILAADNPKFNKERFLEACK